MSFFRHLDPLLRSRSYPPLPHHSNQSPNQNQNPNLGGFPGPYDSYNQSHGPQPSVPYQSQGPYFDPGPQPPVPYQSHGMSWTTYYQETYQSTSNYMLQSQSPPQPDVPYQSPPSFQNCQYYLRPPLLPQAGPRPAQLNRRREEASSSSSSASLRDFIRGRCAYQDQPASEDASPQSSSSPTPPSSEEAEKTDVKSSSDSSNDSRKRKREASEEDDSSSGKDQKSEKGSSGSEREAGEGIVTESQLPSPPNSVKSDDFITDRQIETRRLISETSRRLSDSMKFSPVEKHPDQQGSGSNSDIPRPIPVRCLKRGRSSPGPEKKGELRPVIIDGSNVAFAYGEGVRFACQGLRICVDHFVKLGCEQIHVIVPEERLHQGPVDDGHILQQLKFEGRLVSSWSRKLMGNRWISSYDDRLILEIASKKNGIVISNDHYRDLWRENPSWRYTISHRVIGFCFVPGLKNDIFFPKDPYGINKMMLDRIIRFE